MCTQAGQGHAAPRRAPSPAVGAPVEAEEVEVRFGIPVASDRVSVQLLPASPSRPLTPAAPAAHATPHAADRGDGEDAAGVLAGAARFVFDKIAELRTDLAKARLEMLKGACSLQPILLPVLLCCNEVCVAVRCACLLGALQNLSTKKQSFWQ